MGDAGADVLIVDGISIGTIDFDGGADADTLSISGLFLTISTFLEMQTML